MIAVPSTCSRGAIIGPVPGRLIVMAMALLPACSSAVAGSARHPAAKPSRIREPVDRVGYAHSAAGIEKVAAHAGRLEAARLASRQRELGLTPGTAFSGAISPHDDYRYAQRVYVHVYPHIRARDVVLIGVAHKARRFPATEGKLVFDGFDAWPRLRHGFSHYDLDISPVLVRVTGEPPRLADTADTVWYRLQDDPPGGIAAPVRKLLGIDEEGD